MYCVYVDYLTPRSRIPLQLILAWAWVTKCHFWWAFPFAAVQWEISHVIHQAYCCPGSIAPTTLCRALRIFTHKHGKSVPFQVSTWFHTQLHTVFTVSVLPIGSRARWTSSLHRLPCHSFAVSLALGSYYTPHLPPHHPGYSNIPPPCFAGRHRMALNTGGGGADGGRKGWGRAEEKVFLFFPLFVFFCFVFMEIYMFIVCTLSSVIMQTLLQE